MLTLYHWEFAACGMKSRLALEEKQLEWTGQRVDLMEYEQKEPDYLALNPNGVVPTVIHDGNVLIETDIIFEYLDETFPEHPLRPSDPLERFKMRMWMLRKIEAIHMLYATVWYNEISLPYQRSRPPEEIKNVVEKQPTPQESQRLQYLIENGIDEDRINKALKILERFYQEVEDTLDANKWIAGSQFSFADICVFPYINSQSRLITNLWFDKSPHIQDWLDRMRSRPSFEKAITNYPPTDRLKEYILSAPHGGRESWLPDTP